LGLIGVSSDSANRAMRGAAIATVRAARSASIKVCLITKDSAHDYNDLVRVCVIKIRDAFDETAMIIHKSSSSRLKYFLLKI
jgi:hypothetical protein